MTGHKRRPRRPLPSAISVPLSLALTGCSSSSPSGVPRLPAPAQDLMAPAPTGSKLLGRVSQNMSDWAEKLQGGSIK